MAMSLSDNALRLVRSPLFQLSTAGQELFHTNMLYWLIRTHPRTAHELTEFCFGVGVRQLGPNSPDVRREWKHVDLFVDGGPNHHALALENKLLAVPDSRQLVGYHLSISSQELRSESTEYVLLALIPPYAGLPSPWRLVSYDAFPAPLIRVADELRRQGHAFDGELVAQYAALVQMLVRVRDEYAPTDLSESPVLLPSDLRKELTDARLLSLVEKLRMSRVAARILSEISQRHPVKATLSNTHGIVECFLPHKSGSRVGWQYQSGQFRLVVIAGHVPREPRDAPVRERIGGMFPGYFDFTRLGEGHLASTCKSKLKWLGYGRHFVYQYRLVDPSASLDDLVALGVTATEWAQETLEAS
ncbi:PD-(D/E)XK nuclease family protein [Rhodococcus triatomae]|uniref:PD-(D/E)XK nuclease superfamily protein n=1 Tax=Rhodococcus triatomae TaxID=300028 RepID=A0A1G8SPU6_9NOCA|nr:PD-(D/E)XK nuclease family protein [Rhodococcus triatomae]QNG20806.1 PD-(D/E)XK nuclease family protein [Rhodococcus triatomae]QNG23279.1 PD-(D/E)XK nuclease family protein [Rhodococcus triatomae]SDJ31173.1 PD-(D/E)XK nuclease superfamily protein [Rhodococcus triatomae]